MNQKMLFSVVFLHFFIWFCTSYQFQKTITVNYDHLSGDLVDEHVLIQLNTKGLHAEQKINSECSDIRFIDIDDPSPTNPVELDWMLEGGCGESYTSYWVKIPLIKDYGEKKILAQYGIEGDSSLFGTRGRVLFEGSFYLLFNNDACPSTMTVCDVECEGKFLYGSDTYEEVTLPQASHNHVVNIVTGLRSPYFDFVPGGLNSIHPHSHSFTVPVFSEQVLPEYYELRICKSDYLILYKDTIIMYDDPTVMIDDADVTALSLTSYPQFPIGVFTTFGSYGGTNDHIHQTGGARSTGPDPLTYFDDISSSGDFHEDTALDHDHSLPDHVVQSGDHTPYNIGLIPGVQTVDFLRTSKTGQIFFATDTIPLGFDAVEESIGKYIRFTSSYVVVDGLSEHRHYFSGSSCGFNITNKVAIHQLGIMEDDIKVANHQNHAHNVNEYSSYVNNDYDHIKLFVYKRKDSLGISKGVEEKVNVTPNNPPGGNLIEFLFTDGLWITISSIVVLIVFCFLILFVVVISSICCIMMKKKNSKKGYMKEDLNETELGTTVGGDSKNGPQFRIDSKLMVINHKDLELKSQLGKGGSGNAVYKCNWNGKECAFKIYRTSDFSSQSDYTEFEKEALINSSVSHPNLIQMFGVSLSAPRIGLIIEYAELGDVEQYILKNKGKFEMKNKLKIIDASISGLEFLHKKNIIHRDIKCANIFLCRGFVAKLGDFGLSRIFQKMDVKKTVRIGTQQYMAPEICKGEKYSTSADIHSFGIVIWEIMHESCNPYEGRNVEISHIEFKVANDPNFRPKIDEKKAPKWTKELMIACWNSNPDLRPSSTQIRKIVKKNLTTK